LSIQPRWLPRYLVADVDDTFTVEGCLHPEVLAAVVRAASAGIEVILNTGRPAGYGAALLAYLPGISAVVVENGGAWLDRHRSPLIPEEKIASAGHDRGQIPVQFAVATSSDLRLRLERLAMRVAERAGLSFVETADNPFRLTDYTVVRAAALPQGQGQGKDAAQVLERLARYVEEESDGAGSLLASSIHIHFMLDGREARRSKADGVAALLGRRGVADAQQELFRHAIAIGDSANDASFFAPGRFAFSVGVRNIERYLPELGQARPRHLTQAREGLGFIEVIDQILDGRLSWPSSHDAPA
jgi:hydroxymethylpyrimidine pyrophosphatase-like HAD family hydrolase